ncbi:phosphorylase family protein [Pelotalea chapellei]|uniref:Nucleoside phosphorylase n=1 Tax=Pelotalea chapellei TaxID=44671 RepID=A0ABS5U4R6_9BACT|nr:nucleoside phosphorylase [Pelotalea chapellei]MBT1070643.1 nucleoside phosphorylase [Pelotalea chapellei]
MKIAIVTAMPEETGAVLQGAHQKKKGMVNGRHTCRCSITGHEIMLVEAGMGLLNAGWAATLAAEDKPDLIISAGFGGGVVAGLSVGEVVMAEQVLQWDGTGFEEVAVGFYGRNSAADAMALPRGCFITGDGILRKDELASHLTNANKPVVEMETAAVARVAAGNGIPFLGIRAISDAWDEELSFSINEFCDDTMRIRPAKVLATILKRPSIIPQLIRLARNSKAAAASLGKAMERLLKQI